MPFLQSQQVNFPRIFTFIVFSLVFGIGLLFAIVKLSGSGEIQFKLGDDVFEVGNAEIFAERIREDRGPIPFSSLSGARPIYVQHRGDDSSVGWFAIDARSPSDPVNCGLNWNIQDQIFIDGCDEASSFPADGEGLTRFQVTINSTGVIEIDLNKIYVSENN
tara:strand:+ start:1095 stop:1580 length:486 start_codon:yes stop_codon:yes gene_type:complete